MKSFESKTLYYALPLVFFAVLVIVFMFGLESGDHKEIPSPLIGKPVPIFTVPDVMNPKQQFTHQDLMGKVSLVNIWGSWCNTCRYEHAVLMRIAEKNQVPIYGLAYKDTLPSAQQWLDQLGNPYIKTGLDQNGKVAIDWGVYGTPETFVIDQQGIIRHKQVGMIDLHTWDTILQPLIVRLQRENAADRYAFTKLEQRAQFYELLAQLRCAVCQNQTLADSNAPLAEDLRREIYTKVQAGESSATIMDYMVQRYGTFVLYKPPLKTNTYILWLGPFAILIMGAVIGFLFVRRRSA